jgi:hypothetical protein
MFRQQALFRGLSYKKLKDLNSLGFATWLLLGIATVFV